MIRFVVIILVLILSSIQYCWAHQDSLLNARIDSLAVAWKDQKCSKEVVDVIEVKDSISKNNGNCSVVHKSESENSQEFDWYLLVTLLSPVVLASIGGFVALQRVRLNSKLTLDQTRANSISDARIEWMQKFRNLMSEFLSEVAALNYYLRGVMELAEEKKIDEAKIEYEKTIDRRIKVRRLGTEIALMLNIKEPKHFELDKAIEEFLNVTTEDHKKIKEFSQYEKLSKAIQVKSREILKEVWEQAKNEGKKDGAS